MRDATSSRISRKILIKATLLLGSCLLTLTLGYTSVGLGRPFPTFFFLLIVAGLSLWYLNFVMGRGRSPSRPETGKEFVGLLLLSFLLLAVTCALKYTNFFSRKTRVIPVAYTPMELTLQKSLLDDPCSRKAAHHLSQVYLKHRRHQAVIALEKNFHAQCKDPAPELRWVAFAAAKEMKDFPLAEQLISGLIQSSPADADYYAWRGEVYETLGDWDKAAKDYEDVLRLKPRMRDLPFNLRDAYRRLQKPCQALAVQQRYSALYDDVAADPGVQELTQKLQGECPAAG